MKIGLDTAPAALRGTYFQHLASVLARYAPEHEYIIGAEVNDGVDRCRCPCICGACLR